MEKNQNKFNNQPQAGGIDITYFTDPLCCWSWAFEPEWRKLQYEYQGKLSWHYCMGGLLPAWNNFTDTINSISRPIQMVPVWMQASHVSGMPIEYNLWMKDPPASSYPACIAVKCAQLQGVHYGENYLRMLREAAMLKGLNIAKDEILIQIAASLSRQSKKFDFLLFKEHLYNKQGLEAFKADMELVHKYNIQRFPTLIIRKHGEQSIVISGYRPYNALVQALKKVEPDITVFPKAISKEIYSAYWSSITERELEEGIK